MSTEANDAPAGKVGKNLPLDLPALVTGGRELGGLIEQRFVDLLGNSTLSAADLTKALSEAVKFWTIQQKVSEDAGFGGAFKGGDTDG